MRPAYFDLTAADLDVLIKTLAGEGYRVIGPMVRDQAIGFEEITGVADLPRGHTAVSEPGRYRLIDEGGPALFHYWTGQDSPKRFVHPPRARLSAAERSNGAFRILDHRKGDTRKLAFVGVRPCDLAALRVLDRVLQGDRYVDDIYQERRDGCFVVAAQCTDAAPTCFCESLGTGPTAFEGFDIALTEDCGGEGHRLVAQAGSARGTELLNKLKTPKATAGPPAYRGKQQRAVDMAVAGRQIDAVFDHERWEQTAARCLACTNCTQVCPTCFCVNTSDWSDLAAARAERWRTWDSCFTQGFTYIHGGSVRSSGKSRYRQWFSHKLARWQDQFGMPGCTGCGRCITWCPVGIDITEEYAALMGAAQGRE